MEGRTFRYIEKIGTSSTVARFVPFRFVSPRPRFGTLRYVCSAVHLLAQYRGGIIITRGKGGESERGRGRAGENERKRDSSGPVSMIANGSDWWKNKTSPGIDERVTRIVAANQS